MSLSIDEDSRQVRQFLCQCCNTEADKTWANVHAGGSMVAVYFASCYHHGDFHEAYIDAVLGGWGRGEGDDYADHLTFSCRVGPVQGSPMPAATLTDVGPAVPESPIFGRKLTREEGLAHPRLPDFWRLIDTILERDELVRRHVYQAV